MTKTLRRMVPTMGKPVRNPEPTPVTVQMPTFGPWATHGSVCKCNVCR